MTVLATLLERDAQLAVLAEYADARVGRGRLVLVRGEAGIGKSALLEAFEDRLADVPWYWGACDGLFTPRPLGPLLDIAEGLGGPTRELSRAEAPRDRLFAAFMRQLDELDGLAVFVVEDVHWADVATLDLLRFLGRRVPRTRALVVATYRDDGLPVDDPLRIAVGELTSQRGTRWLSLPPLSAAAVGQLTVGTGLEAAEVHRLTGGNPFFVTEVLRHGSGGLPRSARDAVLAAVARVGAEARGVLDVAALIGARVEPDLLATASGTSAAAVDELLANGLVTSDGDRLSFRHEIARLAVDRAVPAHRRASIHRRVLDALLDSGCHDDARLAFHAEGAGDAEQVLAHAPPAAWQAVTLGAHREAVAQFQRALRFAAATDPRTRADLYDWLAHEISLVDQWEEAAAARRSALELWRQVGDPLREGNTLRCLSWVMWRLCRGAEQSAAVEAALMVLEPLGPTPELARAYACRANLSMPWLKGDVVTEFTDRALAIATALGLEDVTSDALNTRAYTLFGTDPEGSRRLLERALAVAVDAELHEQAGRCWSNLYAMECELLHFDTAERYFVNGVAHCDEHDISTYSRCLRGERTATLARAGHLIQATALAERVLDGGSPVNRLNALISLGRCRARRGEPGAWPCLDEATDLAVGVDEPGRMARAAIGRAEASWLDGDVDQAVAAVRAVDRVAQHCSPPTRSELASWVFRLAGERPDFDLVEPYASQVAKDPGRAAAAWDALGCRYDAALALLDSADEADVRQALERLDELGAVATAQLARRRLRDMGARSVPSGARPSTRAHPAGLTSREQEVLELICAGWTNEQISERLVISVKTVGHHVSAVLGKLGVSSRRSAAAEATRRGLVTPGRQGALAPAPVLHATALPAAALPWAPA